jgi:hypothetical protein
MRFRTSGDVGDLLHSLALIQEASGGPHTYYLVDRKCTKALVSRSHLIIPLVLSQPYIKECRCSEDPVDVDFSEFRTFHDATDTLLGAQRNYANRRYRLNLKTRGEFPWLLDIKPNPEMEGKIIIARSPRYNNAFFPWEDIVKHYGPRLRFVGLPVEHQTFCRLYGHVEYLPTPDFLFLAQCIAGSDLFIGNQSAPLAVAEGLKHRRIVEVCLSVCDVIFKSDTAQWVADGECFLPNVAGSGEKHLPIRLVPMKTAKEVNIGCPPKSGWWYGNMNSTSLRNLADRVRGIDHSLTQEEARTAVLTFTMGKNPHEFADKGKVLILNLYKKAMQKAGYQIEEPVEV